MSATITVITLTRNRPELLRRAMASVQSQVCRQEIEHLVLIDDCPATADMLSGEDLPDYVAWRLMERGPDDRSGPGRSSRLRNFGVQHSQSRWIAFLDDDNAWEPDHLQGLVDCALETGCRAVHSHVQAFNPDGTPYLEPLFPWSRDPEEAREKYWEMVRKKVFTPGSNVFKDRADPLGHPDPVRSVDTGAWLLTRELLIEVPFTDEFFPEDHENVTGEDDKLLAALIAKGEPIACNHKPTLIYYLGGYSNNFQEQYDDTFAWE